jgi:hypothetical protein
VGTYDVEARRGRPGQGGDASPQDPDGDGLDRLARADEDLARLLAHTFGDLDRLADETAAVGDWSHLIGASIRHGVAEVLVHYLGACGAAVPDEVRAEVDRHRSVQGLWQHHLGDVLDAALHALAERSVPVVALKGPIFAERLYPNVEMRPSFDLDLLVRERDFARAVEALEAAGCRTVDDAVNDYHRRHHHHVALMHESGVLVELHFRAHSGFGAIIPAEPLVDRAQPYRTRSGADARVLAPEDELVYLIVHAVRHCEVLIGWLYDVRLLLEANPQLDWELATERARSWRLTRAFALGCDDLRTALGTDIPAITHARTGRFRTAVGRRLRGISSRMAHPSTAGTGVRILYSVVIADGLAASAAAASHNAARVLRRRLRRAFPSLTPPGWAG